MTEQNDRTEWQRVELEDLGTDDLQATGEAFHFPQLGERHNPSAIPMADHAVAALLAQAAVALELMPCAVVDCDNCNEHRKVWWDACNALERTTRIRLQKWLYDEGYHLPEAPWEDVVE